MKFAFLTFITFSRVVQASPVENSADFACSRITKAYSACYQGMDYDPKSKLVSINRDMGRVPCTDGKNLGFYDRLESPDFASQLAIAYRDGAWPLPNRRVNDDAGRFRFDPMFKAIYGDSAEAVRENLVRVKFLNQLVPFNSKNGAANALEAVGLDLLKEAQRDLDLRNYLKPWLTKKLNLATMTFNWRKVAPTQRLSNHSFGAAIDLNNPRAAGPVYWLWDLASQRQKRIQKRTGQKIRLTDVLKSIKERESSDFQPNRIATTPQKLVEVFERHGFIWGGKWFHFDSMHFEYRPEFFKGLHPTCLALEDIDPVPSTSLEKNSIVTGEAPDSTELMEFYHWD